jgi:hypothetical protein
VLIAPCDEDEVLDTGFASFVDNVLDERPVNDRQHFLRHRLGGWEKSGAEASDRKDSLADRFHRNIVIGQVYAASAADRECSVYIFYYGYESAIFDQPASLQSQGENCVGKVNAQISDPTAAVKRLWV